jgi:hypothetical protein
MSEWGRMTRKNLTEQQTFYSYPAALPRPFVFVTHMMERYFAPCSLIGFFSGSYGALAVRVNRH